MASSGSREIEIKLRIPDPGTIETVLTSAGFHVTQPRVFESNVLYDDPNGRLRSQGCALRIRQAGDRTVLTFKGPAENSKHKSREELETVAGDPAMLAAIFHRLGFVSHFRYDKYRTEFGRPGEQGVVTLDETPIGWFLELEGSPDWIDGTARELGFAEVNYLTDSYTGLYRKHCLNAGIDSSMMVFE